MKHHLLGQTFALLTALMWAFALVLFKKSGERIPPVALNLFKNAVGLVLLILTLAAGALLDERGFAPLFEYRIDDMCLLLLSGFLGIALADTLFLHGLNLIGVGLVSIVDCCYTPSAVFFAWLLLGEALTPFHYAGAALVISGVFIASRHDLPPNRTHAQIAFGMVLAALAIALMAFGIVLAKPVLEDFPVVWATTLRLAAGFGFLALFAFLGKKWREHWRTFIPSRSWRAALPGSILGTYVCLIFWIGGFKYTYASVAAVLNQTSVIFAAILATLVLKEPFGARRGAALVLAVIGVLVVTLAGYA